MKKILFILCFLSVKAYAQEPNYVPMKSNYLFRGIKMDSLLIAPVYPDTTTAATKVNFAGSVVRVGSNLYMRNPQLTQWVDLSSAGGGGSTDTTSLSNRINNKVDSVNRVYDSVKYYKNGTGYFAFKDSVGGQNGRWGNDTATIVLAKVHNATGTTLARGKVVMISGANGDVASVILANNKYDSTSDRTIGLVKDPINSGDTGWVVTQGQASKLNLGSYTAGDVLYLDSIDGGLTKDRPIAPYHQVFICIVTRANNGNGLAYVNPLNGFDLTELHDVKAENPLNNQVIVYSDTQQIWKNRNVYSIVDTTSLSNRINNLTFDDVVQNGNFTTSSIGVTNSIDIATSGNTGTLTFSPSNEFYISSNDDDATFFSVQKSTLIILDSTGFYTYIKTGNVDENLTYELPDVGGEILTRPLGNSIYVELSDTSSMLTNYQRTSAFPIATFGAGSGAAGDTSAFSTSAYYGSFYNSPTDTIVVTAIDKAILVGSVSDTLFYNSTFSTSGATAIAVGTKIPPGNYVFSRTPAITTKPTYLSITLIGYRKR